MKPSSSPLLILSLVLVVGILVGCSLDDDRLFERRLPQYTGVQFTNTITEDDTLMNPLDFLYIYNGGGVGTGDLNNDGRPDLYFAGNQVNNRLYLNQGDFQFKEVTAEAGVAADGVWSTGVSIVDINQDGLLDIYLSAGGPPQAKTERTNRLFVNQGVNENGIPSFEEKAEEYGIANSDYTTHAAFFDYDQDGDLDLFVLNNALKGNKRAFDARKTDGEAENTDHLYRNNGDGTFTDVSAEAGVQVEGYGLGVAITDINKDGWPDVYVANDFSGNDLLYINNGDGTFDERIKSVVKHQSYSAMGVDVADFNNDARADILTLDMLPPDNLRRKTMPKAGSYEEYQRVRRFGYALQQVRNALQLNNGPSPEGRYTFSDIAYLAGVEATDWSWAPLFADYDNDGDRDLFVTNGYGQDPTDLDYNTKQVEMRSFGSKEAIREQQLEAIDALPKIRLSNRFFRNKGSGRSEGLQFTNTTGVWASRKAGISNGAAFVDLDQDGDLDLVTNNVNEEASILENHASARDSSNALRVELHGPEGNRGGLGTKLALYNDGTTQYHDHSTYRGYQSSVGRIVHFGLGADSTADSLTVTWPDGKSQHMVDVASDSVLNVHYDEASDRERSGQSPSDSKTYHLREVADEHGLTHVHQEAEPQEYDANPLQPHVYSRNGPGLAVGDVNGDGLDDVFVGGDRGHPGSLFVQTNAGEFTKSPFPGDARYEDLGALFFDADGDGDLDLYVVSGGSAGAAQSTYYQDRLYLNDGSGEFRRATDALPQLRASGSVVTATDYDQDGDLDLFVGGRVIPGDYPLPPRSYLLRNDSQNGEVQFTDVTKKVAPSLAEVGLVSDALWTDYDTDGDRDLMVVGEWMPITLFENENGRFTEATESVGLDSTSGWWNSITAGDFDRDGDMDYVAGNHGLNTRFQGSPSEPVRVHAKDYDKNGDLDPIISRYINGTSYPAHERDDLIEQIPQMQARFPSYQSYGEATFDDVLRESELEGAYERKAVRFETSYLENRSDGTFTVHDLPIRTQIAPVFGLQAGDYDEDGALDLLMVGNWYATHATIGRADAFVGAMLDGDGTGHFDYVNYTESGFLVDGDGKALAEVATGPNSSLILATQNGGRLKAFRPTKEGALTIRVRPYDRWAEFQFADGRTQIRELYYGSSYLAQSSRILHVPPTVQKVIVHGTGGEQRAIESEGLQQSTP